jgi:UDP-N-acetylglucosamine acyltransferase
MAKPKIHKTAIVAPDAKISDGVEIGPFCIVGSRVKIGKNTKLSSHVVIEETEIGRLHGISLYFDRASTPGY